MLESYSKVSYLIHVVSLTIDLLMLQCLISIVDNGLQPLDQRFPGSCFRVQHIPSSPNDKSGFFVGLSQSGSLFLSRSNEEPIATAVSSFTITPTYLVYTTTTHEAHFILLSQLEGSPIGYSEETRRVERGSTIIVAVPSTMSLVLQMPRGNLETICPRPFVLEVIKADIARFVAPSMMYICFDLMNRTS